MSPREVAIVPHTHWDREWYEPFQVFRLRLVGLLDTLLPMLDRDLSFSRFLLDGQTVVLDDYLAVRPDAAPTIARLVASGRVSIGPWACLMDEYMVSGETMVRNLRRGMLRASELGGVMPVGYLPDMFGHVAQMPQLLRLAGLEHAVVWRGVPAAVDRNAFWWVAPDGSRIRAEYLYGSYSNGRDLPDDPERLVTRTRGFQHEMGEVLLDDGGLLLMNGTDHQLPQAGLGDVVAAANAAQDEYHFTITSLPEYLAGQPVTGLPEWHGELRSGARANVLMGVASNRVDVHQACAAAERALERRAEPLSALFVAPDAYPTRLFDEAWELLVLNSAHDSSCACSHDDVVDAVMARYQEARHLCDGLTRAVVHHVAESVDAPPDHTVVINPTPVTRAGMVALRVPGGGPLHYVTDDGTPCPTQVVDTSTVQGISTVVVGRGIRWVLDMMRGHEFAGQPVTAATRTVTTDDSVDVEIMAAAPGDPLLDLDDLREALLEDGDGGRTIRLRQTLPPTRQVLVTVPEVPGYGWTTIRPEPGPSPTTTIVTGRQGLANEHLCVAVDVTDGTLTLTTPDGVTVRDANRLVDGGDGGDTYTYSPPTEDYLVERPEFVQVRVLESGPVRARVLVTAVYRWPAHALGDHLSCGRRSDETVLAEVRTTLELRDHERFLRVHVELDHRARDHRLRAHFPLPRPVTGSDAECAFAVVRRGLTAEGGPHEPGLPTFVSRRFVDCSDGETGLAVLHDGLLEYEVVDGGHELALTLLRATGYLSRAEPALRPNPAGPLLPVVGAQLQKPLAFDYALLPHSGGWEDADLFAVADEVLVPFECGRPGTGHRARSGQALAVTGAAVSAVLREAGGLTLRVFNPGLAPATVGIARDGAPVAGWVVDLLGAPLETFAGEVDLRPGEIATLRITDAG
ncbi:MAG: glycoside hydrolase family 38 C-terminal domain-containing protein [Actinomycetota bacterium]